VPHYVYHVFQDDWKRRQEDNHSTLKPEKQDR